MRKNRTKTLMFLIGLGSLTKIFFLGCLGLSELVVFAVAPFIFASDYKVLKSDRFMLYINLVLLSFGGMLISSVYNNTYWIFIVKATAVYYSILSHLVVFHRLLRRDINSLGWFFIGAMISGLITIFAFNPKVHVSSVGGFGYIGASSVDEIMEGALFWVSHVQAVLMLPIYSLYLKIPTLYPFFAVVVLIGVALKTTVSGRSAVLIALLGAVLMLLGGRTRSSMKALSRKFIPAFLIMVISVFVFKGVYSFAAKNGYLSEGAQAKYFMQSKNGDSLLGIIMGGRIEPFVGMRAAIDSPIIGYGVTPVDQKNFYLDFLSKYGDLEDIKLWLKISKSAQGAITLIPTHYHIIGDWVTNGILGVLPWAYVLYLMFVYLRKYADAIPEWFGYLAFNIAFYSWHIFFSPIGTRPNIALFVATLLIVKGVGEKRLVVNNSMSVERFYI